jgi:hypothetical protein
MGLPGQNSLFFISVTGVLRLGIQVFVDAEREMFNRNQDASIAFDQR